MTLSRTLVPLLLAALLAACASPAPPARLVQMRAAPPLAAPAALNAGTWQLMLPLRLPDYLDRDAILVPQGQAGLAGLPGQRWAEPLRDSVPRLLRADLATLLGEARVWSSPLPPGVVASRQLRIEFLAFESNAEQSAVQLSARWSLVDAAGSAAPRAGRLMFSVPVAAGGGVDGLVAAHRLALWQLAQAVVEQAAAPAR